MLSRAFSKLIMFTASLSIATLMLIADFEIYACEVLSLRSTQEAFDGSASVFSGKVVRFQEFREGVDVRMALLEVDRYWKSQDGKDYEEAIVITELDHGACGYDFEEGKDYLVYANPWSYDVETLSTSIGTRTQPIETAQDDLALLGEGSVPTSKLSWDEQIEAIDIRPLPTGQESQAESTILAMVGVGAAISGGIAFALFRRNR